MSTFKAWVQIASLRSVLFPITLAAGLSAAAGAVWAQSVPRSPQDAGGDATVEPGPGDTVMERARPGYDPVGIRAGGFFIYPEVGVTEFYRSNIFYTPSNEEDDFITVVSPAVRAKSNWNVHGLSFYAEADYGHYLLNEDENYLDFRSGVDGHLDIRHDLRVLGGLSVAHLHESRSSPEQTGADEPVTYMRYSGNAAVEKDFSRLSTRLGGDVQVYRDNDVDAVGGGTFNSDDRDRTESEAALRLGYELTPRVEPFVRASVNDRSYRQRRDDFGQVRDSWGWETVAGAAFDLGGVTFGEVYVGYLQQNYEGAGLKNVSGPSFGAEVVWNPTELTTVTVGAERGVEETTLAGASGALQSSFDARVDHELRRNLILSANTGFTRRDYRGISRTDDLADIGASLRFLTNRFLEMRAGYSFSTRDSSASGNDYDAHTISVGVTAKF